MQVTRAEVGEGGAVLSLLERAMAEDPFVAWLARPGPRHARARRAYVSMMLERIALPRGEVYVARDDGVLLGAALYAPPHTFDLGAAETLRILPLMVDVIGIGRMTSISRTLDLIDAARPPEPRWLLTMIGVDPSARGRGVGGALLQPVLEACDTSGLDLIAETANPAALPFYARWGFDTLEERPLDETTTSWTLRRPGHQPED
ncbi:MAG: GNAT family N-acetyltransferase [Sandaracinaceae bacterium]